MIRNLCQLAKLRDKVFCDILIIGVGPAGLSAAIRLKQLQPDLKICMLEKAVEIGAHSISGGAFEPRALDELLPKWRSMNSPINTTVSHSSLLILTQENSFKIPEYFYPEWLRNRGNYIISLSDLVKWLANYAENLGVEIFPGFPAVQLLMHSKGYAEGAVSQDFGLDKEGFPKKNYEAGIEFRAKQTLLAEGSKGYLSEEIIKNSGLRNFFDGEREIVEQNYSLGMKEIWKVDESEFESGLVVNTLNWPLEKSTPGRGFIYHQNPGLIHINLAIGLDYKNPHLTPFKEFQKYKTHPLIRKLLKNGERISYGAKIINEGGFFSIPKLTFPGGMLIGCSAGFLNIAKFQGIHTAMKTGMLAAEAISESFQKGKIEGKEIFNYYELFRKSWVWEELFYVRNLRAAFSNNLWWGMIHAYLSDETSRKSTLLLNISRRGTHCTDEETTEYAHKHKKIEYEEPDGLLTFDLKSSVELSRTHHEIDQPTFVVVNSDRKDQPAAISFNFFEGIEERICPAGVFEIVGKELVVDETKCLHCKACEVKVPGNYIEWLPSEGGGGPY